MDWLFLIMWGLCTLTMFVFGCIFGYKSMHNGSKALAKDSRAAKFIRLSVLWVFVFLVALVPLTYCWMFPYYKGESEYPLHITVFIISLLSVISCIILYIAEFIVALKYKQYGTASGHALLGSLACLVGPVLFVIFCMLYNQQDDFGKRHPIQAGVAHEVPLSDTEMPKFDTQYMNSETPRYCYRWYKDTEDKSALVDSAQIGTFEVYASPYIGDYFYATYLKDFPEGVLFLRAYEATSNIELSLVFDATNVPEFQGVRGFSKGFRIDTGSWGDPYAARIELWFAPDGKPKKAVKLAEKVYRVEGWSR